MTQTAISIRVYSFYLFLMGLGLVLVPNLLLHWFGFADTKDIWIRMLGLFTFTTGIYYFYASAHHQMAFYQATVIGRLFFFLMTIVFVFVFHQSLMLAVIGSVDLVGGLWTYATLKRYQP
ncbi:hypothetical protein ACFOW1_15085 [Parasediminibacterium paludis]|uniref:Uncharacterized protein n=1 Tax=Parasediminibacterium paludis TaxID=908966 RepID=A0ABV8Q083_9BACT